MHGRPRFLRKPDGLLSLVTDAHVPLVYRVASRFAVCCGALSLLLHVSILLGFISASWTSDLLFPPAFASLVVAGLLAAWRGRDEPILGRYDAAVQGWRPWSARMAKLTAFYSVACFLAFIAIRVSTRGELSSKFSLAIAASHSAAFFLMAAMIFSASPPDRTQGRPPLCGAAP